MFIPIVMLSTNFSNLGQHIFHDVFIRLISQNSKSEHVVCCITVLFFSLYLTIFMLAANLKVKIYKYPYFGKCNWKPNICTLNYILNICY